jgi:hypothetical protein
LVKVSATAIEEGGPPVDTRLPDFKNGSNLGMLARSTVDGYRLEQMKEIEGIKETLALKGFPQSMVTLQRAILMPAELESVAEKRRYPMPDVGLMLNPFPKKKKKGKKKKGGKKKK